MGGLRRPFIGPQLAMSAALPVLAMCIIVGLLQTAWAQSFPQPGAERTAECQAVSLQYAGESVEMVAPEDDVDDLNLVDANGDDAALFPRWSDLRPLVDASCNCIREAVLEVDVTVPQQGLHIGKIIIEDAAGRALVVAEGDAITADQKSYTDDGSSLFNRLHVWVSTADAGAGEWNKAARLRLFRIESPAVSPEAVAAASWVVGEVVIRSGCKECSYDTDGRANEFTVIPFAKMDPDAWARSPSDSSEQDTALVALRTATAMLPAASSGGWVDLSAAVDPRCNCLRGPGPSIRFEVRAPQAAAFKLTTVRIISAVENGRILYEDSSAAASLQQASTWSEGVVSIVAANHVAGAPAWAWSSVRLEVERSGSGSLLPAENAPQIRNVYLSVPGEAAAVVSPFSLSLRGRATSLVAPASRESPAFVIGDDGVGSAEVPLDVTDWSPVGLPGACRVARPTGAEDAADNGGCDGAMFRLRIAGEEGDRTRTTAVCNSIGGLEMLHWDGFVYVVVATLGAPDCKHFLNGPYLHWDWGLRTAEEEMVPVTHLRILVAADSVESDGWRRVPPLTPLRIGQISVGNTVAGAAAAASERVPCNDDEGRSKYTSTWSPFQQVSATRWWQCRECCCSFPDPSNPDVKGCYDQGDRVDDITPRGDFNDQCKVCNRLNNPAIMTPRTTLFDADSVVPCNDQQPCTSADHCRTDGMCVATVYTSCLIKDFWDGDPTRDCELCDGTGENSPTLGCTAKPGHYVKNPGTVSRACGCLIDGVIYAHEELNPLAPCLYCDILNNREGWTTKPDNVACDITLQADWENRIDQACTYRHTCTAGVCRGLNYTCPRVPACATPKETLPRFCDLTGPASESAGCQIDLRPDDYVCRPFVNGCLRESTCEGLAACRPRRREPGIIYIANNRRMAVPLLPSGNEVHDLFPVVSDAGTLAVRFRNFSVQCDELAVRWAIIHRGECDDERVSRTVGRAFGTQAAAGTGVARLEPGLVKLGYPEASGPDGGFRLVNMETQEPPVRLHNTDLSHFVDPVCNCVRQGVLTFEYKHKIPDYQLRAADLFDTAGRRTSVVLEYDGQDEAVGDWASMVAPMPRTSMDDFDWASISHVEFRRQGVTVIPEYDRPRLRVDIRNIEFYKRFDAPCLRRDIIAHPMDTVDVSTESSFATEVAIARTDLTPFIYQSRIRISSFLAPTYLTLEVWKPDSVPTPYRAVLFSSVEAGDNGQLTGLHVRLPAAESVPSDKASTLYRIPLNSGAFTPFEFTSWDAIDRIRMLFPSGPEEGITFRVLRVALTTAGNADGSSCSSDPAPGMQHQVLFEAGGGDTPLTLVPDTMTPVLGLDGHVSVATVPGVPMPMNLLPWYDSDCNCIANAYIHLRVSYAKPTCVLTRVDLVNGADRGLSIPLQRRAPRPVYFEDPDGSDASGGEPVFESEVPQNPLRFGLGEVNDVLVPITVDHLVNGPSADTWGILNKLVFYRSGKEQREPTFRMGSIVVHSVTLHRVDFPCDDPVDAMLRDMRPESLKVVPYSVPLSYVNGVRVIGDSRMMPEKPDKVTFSRGMMRDAQVEGTGAVRYRGVDAFRDMIVAAGDTTGTVRLAGQDLPIEAPNGAAAGIVVASQAAGGHLMWSFQLAPSGTLRASASSVTHTADMQRLLVAGHAETSGSLTTALSESQPGITIDFAGGEDALLVGLGPRFGDVEFVGHLGSSHDEQFTSVATAGNTVAVAGWTADTETRGLSAVGTAALLTMFDVAPANVGDNGRVQIQRSFAWSHPTAATEAVGTSVLLRDAGRRAIVAGTYDGGVLMLHDTDPTLQLPFWFGDEHRRGFVGALDSETGSWMWACSFFSKGVEIDIPANAIAATDGRVYVAGEFAVRLVVLNGPDVLFALPVAGSRLHGFVAAFDEADGRFLWANQFGGVSSNSFATAVVATSSLIFVVGSCDQDCAAGAEPDALTSYSPKNANVRQAEAVLGRFQAENGDCFFLESFGDAQLADVAVGAVLAPQTGDILVAGSAGPTVEFGKPAQAIYKSSTSAGAGDGFVAAFSSDSADLPRAPDTPIFEVARDADAGDWTVSALATTAATMAVASHQVAGDRHLSGYLAVRLLGSAEIVRVHMQGGAGATAVIPLAVTTTLDPSFGRQEYLVGGFVVPASHDAIEVMGVSLGDAGGGSDAHGERLGFLAWIDAVTGVARRVDTSTSTPGLDEVTAVSSAAHLYATATVSSEVPVGAELHLADFFACQACGVEGGDSPGAELFASSSTFSTVRLFLASTDGDRQIRAYVFGGAHQTTVRVSNVVLDEVAATLLVVGTAQSSSGAAASFVLDSAVGGDYSSAAVVVLPANGDTVSWCALYEVPSMRLSWHTVVSAPAGGDVSVADSVVSENGVLLCGSTSASTGDVVVASAGGISAATIGSGMNGWIARIDASTGALIWLTPLATGSDGWARCESLTVHSGIVFATGTVVGAGLFVGGSFVDDKLSAEDGPEALVVAVATGTGDLAAFWRVGAANNPYNLHAEQRSDTGFAIAVEPTASALLMISSTTGTVSLAGADGNGPVVSHTLGTSGATTTDADVVIWRIAVAALMGSSGSFPLLMNGRFVVPSTGNAGKGIAQSVSAGGRRVLWSGQCSGSFGMGDTSMIGDCSSDGTQVFSASAQSDGHVSGLSVGVNGNPLARTTAMAATGDGQLHLVAGWVQAAAGALRDNYAAVIDDFSGTVVVESSRGSTSGADEWLCVASSARVGVWGGYASGRPTFPTLPDADADGEDEDGLAWSRHTAPNHEGPVCVVAVASVSGAFEHLGATAFGTSETSGSCFVTSVAVASSANAVVFAGFVTDGTLKLGESVALKDGKYEASGGAGSGTPGSFVGMVALDDLGSVKWMHPVTAQGGLRTLIHDIAMDNAATTVTIVGESDSAVVMVSSVNATIRGVGEAARSGGFTFSLSGNGDGAWGWAPRCSRASVATATTVVGDSAWVGWVVTGDCELGRGAVSRGVASLGSTTQPFGIVSVINRATGVLEDYTILGDAARSAVVLSDLSFDGQQTVVAVGGSYGSVSFRSENSKAGRVEYRPDWRRAEARGAVLPFVASFAAPTESEGLLSGSGTVVEIVPVEPTYLPNLGLQRDVQSCTAFARGRTTLACARTYTGPSYITRREDLPDTGSSDGLVLGLSADGHMRKWAAPLRTGAGGDSDGEGAQDDEMVAAAAVEDFLCVLSNVGGSSGVGVAEGLVLGDGGSNVLLSCRDEATGEIMWQAGFGASESMETASALLNFFSSLVVFATTNGAPSFANTSMAYRGFGREPRPVVCAILLYDGLLGSELDGRLFGGTEAGDECHVTGVAHATVSGLLIVAGEFVGTRMVFDSGVGELDLDGAAGRSTAFVAAYDIGEGEFTWSRVVADADDYSTSGAVLLSAPDPTRGSVFGVAAVRARNDAAQYCRVFSVVVETGAFDWTLNVHATNSGADVECPGLQSVGTYGIGLLAGAQNSHGVRFGGGAFSPIVSSPERPTGSSSVVSVVALLSENGRVLDGIAVQAAVPTTFLFDDATNRWYLGLVGQRGSVFITTAAGRHEFVGGAVPSPVIVSLGMSAPPMPPPIPVLDRNLRPLVDEWDGKMRQYYIHADVKLAHKDYVLKGGMWRQTATAGVGFSFAFDTSQQTETNKWISVSAPVLAADNFDIYGPVLLTMWEDVGYLAMERSGPLYVPKHLGGSVKWEIRNVRLTRDDITCSACASVQLWSSPWSFTPSPTSIGDFVADPSAGLALRPGDLSAVTRKDCNCLVNTTVRVRLSYEGFSSSGDSLPAACRVTAVFLGSASGSGVVVPLPNVPGSLSAAVESQRVEFDWHRDTSKIDWTNVGEVVLSVADGPACDAARPDGASVLVEDITVSPHCEEIASFYHPTPQQAENQVVFQRNDLGLVNGMSYRVLAVGVNVWGDVSAPVCSERFVVDVTPPDVRRLQLFDAVPYGVATAEERVTDISYTKYSSFRVRWVGHVLEPESAPDNIVDWEISAVALSNGTRLPGVTSEIKTFAVSSDLAKDYVETNDLDGVLNDGVVYYPVLRVWNRGELYSERQTSGVTVDRSPPFPVGIGIVDLVSLDGSDDVDATPTDTQIVARWEFAEPHTAVARYRVALGVTRDSILRTWIDVGTAEQHVFSAGWSFEEGQFYYVHVRAENLAGAFADYTSDGILVDKTPPYALLESPYEVMDLPQEAVAPGRLVAETPSPDDDVDVRPLAGPVRAKWGCDDDESVAGGTKGAMLYSWRVCRDAQCTAVLRDWEDRGSHTYGEASTAGFSLESGSTMFVQAKCTNPAGLSSTYTSDGVVVDNRAPSAELAVVRDLLPGLSDAELAVAEDASFLPATAIHAAWDGFRAAGPGAPAVRSYIVSVGTSVGGDDAVSGAFAGSATDLLIENIALDDGVLHFITVTAASDGGVAQQTSNGFIADANPPMLEAFFEFPGTCDDLNEVCSPPQSAGTQARAQAATSRLRIGFVAEDLVSGVGRCSWGFALCNEELSGGPLLPTRAVSDLEAQQVTLDLSFALTPGAEYCGVVECVDLTEQATTVYTDPLLIDTRPPEFEPQQPTSGLGVWHARFTTPAQFSVYCPCDDGPIGGIHHYEVRLERVDLAAGGATTTVFDFTNIGSEPRHTFDGLELDALQNMPDIRYQAVVRCVDHAGLADVGTTPLVAVDATQPEHDPDSGGVAHHNPHINAAFWGANTKLAMSWRGFTDAESGVVGFSWALGTEPGSADVRPAQHVGTAVYAEAEDLDLIEGATYYVTVWAENAAGGISVGVASPLTVHAIDPDTGSVVALPDQPTGSNGFVSSTQRVEVEWEVIGGIRADTTYDVALGTTPYGEQSLKYINVGNVRRTVLSHQAGNDFHLVPGVEYYVTVVARTPTGLLNTAFTSVVADPHPPELSFVHDGVSMVTSTSLIAPIDTVYCSWQFSDIHSHLSYYEVGLGTKPGVADVLPFGRFPGNASTASLPAADAIRKDLSLAAAKAICPTSSHSNNTCRVPIVEGGRYHCIVRAFDAAGNHATASSPGARVDWSPPDVRVMDGWQRGVDVDYQDDSRVVRMQWSAPDDVSSVKAVQWAVGSAPGLSDVLPWREVPLRPPRAVALVPSALVSGVWYYSTVRVYTPHGLVGEAASDGFVPDPPNQPLSVHANLLHLFATASGDARSCSCPDNRAAFTVDADFSCQCEPGSYLGPRGCTDCPAGTCKSKYGNSPDLCTVQDCAGEVAMESLPRGPAELPDHIECDAFDPAKFAVGFDCVCPPGMFLNSVTQLCVPCPKNYVKEWLGDSALSCVSCDFPRRGDTNVHITWTPPENDALRRLRGYRVSLGSSPSSASVERSFAATVRSATMSMQNVPAVQHGSSVYVTVAAIGDGREHGTTEVEYVIAREAVRLIVDYTPPTQGVIYDGTTPGDATVQGDVDRLGANWDLWQDEETGVVSCQVAFGTAPLSADASFGVFHSANCTAGSFELRGLQLIDGLRYYATLRGFNGLGGVVEASSNGVLIQHRLPRGVVHIQAWGKQEIARNGSGAVVTRDIFDVRGSWSFGSDRSGLLEYSWTLYGVDSGGVRLERLRNSSLFSDSTVCSVDAVEVPTGTMVVLVVIARNEVGVTAEAASHVKVLDATAPIAGEAVLHAVDSTGTMRRAPLRGSNATVVYQSSRTELAGAWLPATDPETPIDSYSVMVGSVIGGDQAVRPTEFSAGTTQLVAHFSELDLSDGECYVLHVTARSAAGLRSSTAVSNRVCVDRSPPNVLASLRIVGSCDSDGRNTCLSPAGVNSTFAGGALHVSAYDTSASVGLTGRAFDAGSGIAAVVVAVHGPQTGCEGACDEDNYADGEGLGGEGWDGERLAEGSQAVDASADPTAAIQAVVSVDSLSGADGAFSIPVLPFLHHSAIGAGLTPDVAYQAVVTTVNGAGEEARFELPPVTFVATGPTILGLGHTPLIGAQGLLVVTWVVKPGPAPLVTAEWRISSDDGDVYGPVVADIDGRGAVAYLKGLRQEVEYRVIATVCDSVGLCGSSQSQLAVDASPPIAGDIGLRTPENVYWADVVSSNSTTPVLTSMQDLRRSSLSWTGFSDPGGAIDHFIVRAGTSPGGAQVVRRAVFPPEANETLLADVLDTPHSAADQLLHGDPLYLSVEAVDRVGLRAPVTLLALVLDAQGPEPAADAAVRLEEPATRLSESARTTAGVLVSADFAQSIATRVIASWLPFEVGEGDLASPLAYYRAELLELNTGDVPGSQSLRLVAAQQLPVWNNTVSFDDLSDPLPDATVVRVRVSATDVSGNPSAAMLSAPLRIDTSPPRLTASGVRDGLAVASDIDCHPMTGVPIVPQVPTLLHAVVALEQSLADASSADSGDMPLNDTQLAVNAQLVYNVSDPLGDHHHTVLGVTWDGFVDSVSPIVMLEIAVGSTAGASDVLAWTEIPATLQQVQVVLPIAAEGSLLYPALRATDSFGHTSSPASTDGVRLLCDPSSATCQHDGYFLCLS